MMVSILICTRNRAEELAQTLQALQQVEVPPDHTAELVLVDNGSTDSTASLLRGFQWTKGQVRVIQEPRRGKGHAYNRGLSAATGAIVLLTDDDVRPPRDWIATMCEPIWSGRAAMVAGGVVLAPHLLRPWMTPQLRSFLSSTERLDAEDPSWVVAANLAFARRVLERVPAFDPALGPGALGFEDEVLFSWQVREAGFRVVGVFDQPVEHWFDARRLARAALTGYLRSHGRSKAYVEYHWIHREVRRPRLAWYRALARWLAFLAAHPGELWRQEGISEAESELLVTLGYAAQYLIERRRPRRYARRGLVKTVND